MTVEKVLVPVGTIFGVRELSVKAHYRRDKLSNGKDDKASNELGVNSQCRFRGFFTLKIKISTLLLEAQQSREMMSTLAWASAIAAIMMPTVSIDTLNTASHSTNPKRGFTLADLLCMLV